MTPPASSTSLAGAFLLLALLWPSLCFAQNKAADFCATLNTADGSANMSIYQTQGLCRDHCSGEYAFAILNYQSCWCSNFEPAKSEKVDDDDCNIRCPAYSEWCGGKGDKFGYLALGKTPEGTKSADSTTATSTTSSKTSEAPISDDSVSPTISTGPGGETVTITPSDSAEEGAALSGGAIAGIAVGVVGVVAAAGVAGFFLIRRRRSREDHFDPRHSNSTAFTDLKDASGLTTPGAAVLAGPGNRGSRLMPADPRMDPYSDGLYVRTKSRESVNTLHDEQDYSRRVHQPRVLRAMNPDPDVEH